VTNEPRIPAFVQVGPFRYSIIIDQAAIDRASVESKVTLNGHTDHSEQRMTIAPDLADDRLVEVLVHEVLHAITNLVGLDNDLDDGHEEAVVARLAPAVVDLLRRNPDLVAAIVG
jgi:hypothetical protein